jgi:hypothetical protein
LNPLLVGLIGFGILLIVSIMMVIFSILRRKSQPVFRDIPAFARMRHAVGRVVEDGTRLHVSLGHGSLYTPQSASGLAGLVLLRRLAELTSAGDEPPIVTSGEPVMTILSQDTLERASQVSAQGAYDPTLGRLTGLTPFSYAAGAMTTIPDENISANVFIGNFGPEAALLTEAAERKNIFTLAGSDNLTAQAIFFANAEEPLLGEEAFAAGAYTEAGPMHITSLKIQDVLRWLVIIAILIGALVEIIKLAGAL